MCIVADEPIYQLVGNMVVAHQGWSASNSLVNYCGKMTTPHILRGTYRSRVLMWPLRHSLKFLRVARKETLAYPV